MAHAYFVIQTYNLTMANCMLTDADLIDEKNKTIKNLTLTIKNGYGWIDPKEPELKKEYNFTIRFKVNGGYEITT